MGIANFDNIQQIIKKQKKTKKQIGIVFKFIFVIIFTWFGLRMEWNKSSNKKKDPKEEEEKLNQIKSS